MRVAGTSLHVGDTRLGRWAWARFALIVLLLVAVVLLEYLLGWPDVGFLRERVESAGALGALVFVVGYSVLCLLPAPKGLLTALGGLLYGLWLGALLSWAAAMAGAHAAFFLGRVLGREAVDTLTRGRLERADRLLAEHGLGAVVAARLVPVLPFTAINYAAGLTGVRLRDYLVGSALGIVPGTLAYTALGAWGTDPWGIFAGVGLLVALVVVGGLVGRRVLSDRTGDATSSPEQENA